MDVWIGRDGNRQGPFKEEDVRAWLRTGQLAGNELGWYDGLADWQPLSVLFRDEIPGTPPPPFSTAAQGSPAWPSSSASGALNDYAGFWRRVGAWLIDALILSIPNGLIYWCIGSTQDYLHYIAQLQSNADFASAANNYLTAVRPVMIVLMLMGFLYYTFFEASPWQATPGKMALSIRVVDLQGQRLSLARSAARNVVRLFGVMASFIRFVGNIPFVSYLFVAWMPRKQGLHDLVARTLVLNGRARRPH